MDFIHCSFYGFLYGGGTFLFTYLANNGILPKGQLLIILYIGIVMVLTFYSVKWAAFAKVEVTLSENSVNFQWLENFLFTRKSIVHINFSEVFSYVIQNDSNWSWLKIKFKDNKTFRIWHSQYSNKDDYWRFTVDFEKTVESFNKSTVLDKSEQAAASNFIHSAKTIYETTWGLVLGIIGLIIIIGLPVLLITLPAKKMTNYGLLAAAYIGTVYFVLKVYNSRKNKPSR